MKWYRRTMVFMLKYSGKIKIFFFVEQETFYDTEVID